jgi:N-acetylmuramoyl-L-alanine amidase
MKKCFFIILVLFVFSLATPALVITHPEQREMTVSEDGIFFAGKVDRKERIYINNNLITPSKSRAFSYSVPLKLGENIFTVQKKDWLGNVENIKYTITRTTDSRAKYQNEFVEKEKANYITLRDNVVLRRTPVDAGMNRLGYLPKGTVLYIDGVQNGFSRVYLSKDKYGWVMTKDVSILPPEFVVVVDEVTGEEKEVAEYVYHPKTILSTEQTKQGDERGIVINLSENSPYSAVVENNKLIVSVYNLNNSSETFSKEYSLGKFPRYSVEMKDNSLEIVLKKCPISKNTYSNRDVVIVVDAGHGGKEIGAVGCLGHKEKDINLEIANRLKKLLELHNFQVYMTRDKDSFVSLDDRVKFGKEKDALIFLSIHMNSVPISSNPALNRGSVVFYYNPQSKPLAQSEVKVLSQDLQTVNGGVTQASFAVIRPTEYIGVLAEIAYLVNPEDVSIYKSKRFYHNSALALYKGLVNYIHSSL